MVSGGDAHKKVKVRKTDGTLGMVASTPFPTQVTARIIYPGSVASWVTFNILRKKSAATNVQRMVSGSNKVMCPGGAQSVCSFDLVPPSSVPRVTTNGEMKDRLF